MEVNKDKGPIFSRYDNDQTVNYSPVAERIKPPLSAEEAEFILAHKLDVPDARRGLSRFQSRTVLEPEAASLSQAPALRDFGSSTERAQARHVQSASGSAAQRRSGPQTRAQQNAVTIGILIWILLILFSVLMSFFGR